MVISREGEQVRLGFQIDPLGCHINGESKEKIRPGF